MPSAYGNIRIVQLMLKVPQITPVYSTSRMCAYRLLGFDKALASEPVGQSEKLLEAKK